MVSKDRIWRDIPVWFAAWSSMFSIGLLFVFFQALSLIRQGLSRPGGVSQETGFLFETWAALYRAGFSYQSVFGALAAIMFVSLAINFVFWFWRRGQPAQALYWLFYTTRSWLAIIGFCLFLVYILKLPLVRFLPGNDPQVTLMPFTWADALFLAGVGYLFLGLWLAHPLQSAWLVEWERKFRAGAERLGAAFNRWPSFWSALAAALLPVGLACALVYGAWDARLLNYRPMFWNDAAGYWLWARQFAHVGFGGGYNYPNELMPAWAFNRFGEGSPLYVYVYGAVGRLLGWQAHLPVLINFAVLSLSIWIFSRRTRLDTIQNLILGGALAVAWPLWLFLLTASHETLNQALGTMLALGFLVFLQKEPLSTASKIAWLTLGIFAALTRLSWVLLLYPLLFYSFSGSLLRRAGLALAAWIPLAAAVVFITRQLIPPIQNSIFTVLGAVSATGIRAMVGQFFVQIRFLLKFQDVGPSLLVVILMLILAGISVRAIRNLRRERTPWEAIFHTQEAFDAYNMLLLLAAGTTLYLAQGFYRVFFAALWVSLLMHIAKKRYAFVRIFLIMNLFFMPFTLNYYGDWEGAIKNYTPNLAEHQHLQAVMEKKVVFDAAADNPWCNTILIPVGLYEGHLTILPAGIGVSYISHYPLTHPVHSKYLLLDPETYAILTQEYGLQAELLASLPIGDLYQNLEADCRPFR